MATIKYHMHYPTFMACMGAAVIFVYTSIYGYKDRQELVCAIRLLRLTLITVSILKLIGVSVS